jgi:cytochrome c oxidase subunit 2
MITQNEVWLVSLIEMVLIALVFIYVISQAGKAADATQVQKKAYAIRRWWFIAFLVLGIGVTDASLKPFPSLTNTRGRKLRRSLMWWDTSGSGT